MTDELRLAGYREPLGLWVRAGARLPERPALRVEDLEFTSRGDRVPGRVMLPAEGGGPYPLVLLQDGGAARERALASIGAAWAERGAAVAAIDLPLCGARADPKLASSLGAASLGAALARERARQAVIDLERALDALATRDWIDDERIAFVGLGDGARLGAPWCALEPRLRAAVLDAAADDGADASRALERIAPRPLLRLAERDAPRGGELPEPARRAIWEFLASAFGL